MNGLSRPALKWACPVLLVLAAGGHARGQSSWVSRFSFWGDAESHADIPPASKTVTEFQRRVLVEALRRDPRQALQNQEILRQLKEIIESPDFQRLQLAPTQRQQVDILKGYLRGQQSESGRSASRPADPAPLVREFKENGPAWQESIGKIIGLAPNPSKNTAVPEETRGGPGEIRAAGSAGAGATELGQPADDEFERWLLRQTARLNRWGERLGRWPALQQALRSARVGLSEAERQNQGRSGGDTSLGRQVFRLVRRLQPEKYLEKLNVTVKQNFGESPLGRFRMPRPPLPWGELPSFGVPDLGAPSGGGSGADFGLIGVLAAAASAQVLWLLHHKRKQARAAGGERRGTGRWPVAPATISSREDFIKAFEYLSLSHLGPDARAWNHLDIAAALGEGGSDRRTAAGRLAALYEQARYAPGEEPLGDDDLAAARSNLSYFAGATGV